jgi:hypothetical protein
MCTGVGASEGLGGAVWPHLTSTDIELIVGLRALWKAPEWGLRVLNLAYAIRRYRRHGS